MDFVERVKNCRNVFYAFSGGRDSQAALELTLPMFRKQGIEPRVLYIDNKSERPGIREHCEYICERLHCVLTVIEGPTFQDIYEEKKHWPSSIHRDCIEKLINGPMDRWLAKEVGKQDYILVRGGRKSQRLVRHGQGKTATNKTFQLVKSLPNAIIYNPLWRYHEYQCQLPVWPGYARGYTRTQCYMCPFASIADWRTMRRLDPEQWEETRGMFERYAFAYLKGDSYPRRIIAYWQEEVGSKVRIERFGKEIELKQRP